MKRHIRGHTWSCSGFPAAYVLTVIRKVAAAMRLYMCVFQPTENELFLANYGAVIVLPVALLLTLGNCYCCTQLCYKGGFLLPCKDCWRRSRRYTHTHTHTHTPV